jgi:tetratricopeptide (TPR) repeat protein
VCTLSDLPEFQESVLLDIDTDFMIIDRMAGTTPCTTPWTWPEELLNGLRKRGLRTDFATVVYSVEGGSTPLDWKYLGDELAQLLLDPHPTHAQRRCADLKRQAAIHREMGRFDEARSLCRRALALAPGDASTRYHLAQLNYESGRPERAANHYARTIELDPTYRTTHNTLGPVYFERRCFDRAEQEYKKALAFDAADAAAHLGLAEIYFERKSWQPAVDHYRRAAELRPDDGEAQLKLGQLLYRLRDRPAAEAALERACLSEPHAAHASYRLGDLYYATARRDAALGAYRMAWQRGLRDIRIRSRLARLYLRRGNPVQAYRYLSNAPR